MSLRHKVMFLWSLCLSYKVIMTGSEVTFVNRSVTDSFFIGKDGCVKNGSVCTSSATCHSHGSCVCNAGTPNFRRTSDRTLEYGESYGCLENLYVRNGVFGKFIGSQ